MSKHTQTIWFRNRGFTLIEIMVVIIILGILAGLLVPRIIGRPEEAKAAHEQAAKLDPQYGEEKE